MIMIMNRDSNAMTVLVTFLLFALNTISIIQITIAASFTTFIFLFFVSAFVTYTTVRVRNEGNPDNFHVITRRSNLIRHVQWRRHPRTHL